MNTKGDQSMYSRIYEPVSDLSAYLARIGAGPCEAADKEYLDRLISLHQTHIPFENLSIYDLDEPVSMDTEDLFDKLVKRGRGGFCFELNGLFCHLLKGCGYDVQEARARVVMDQVYGGHVPPGNHRIELVRLGGRYYFCDVGFGGPSPSGALLVEDGYEEEMGGRRFCVERMDEYWWRMGMCREEGFEPLIEFTLQPQDPVEFAPLAGYYSTTPLSKFVANRVLNLRTEKGRKSIFNDVYTLEEDGKVTETAIRDKEDLWRIVREEFGIRI